MVTKFQNKFLCSEERYICEWISTVGNAIICKNGCVIERESSLLVSVTEPNDAVKRRSDYTDGGTSPPSALWFDGGDSIIKRLFRRVRKMAKRDY
jgi:hypothetical protein